MKKILLITMLLLGMAFNSHATLFTFEGTDNGGIGSATMDITISGNTLTLLLDNTSPLADFNPGITGFGFNLSNIPGLSSWTLTAFDSGSNPLDITSSWVIGTTQAGVTLDFLSQTDLNGIKGALYNPGATDGFGGPPQYFTTATLTMIFDSAPILATEPEYLGSGLSGVAYVRMQNVGEGGEGSLKLVPVPEPGTLLLLGAGIVGLAVFRRKIKF